MSGAERYYAILIAALAGTGLLLASRILEGPDKRRRQMFCYYTNLSNLAMLIVHVLLLIPGRSRVLLLTPRARYLTVLCILVTFVIYFFVLTRFGRHSKKTSMAFMPLALTSIASSSADAPLNTSPKILIFPASPPRKRSKRCKSNTSSPARSISSSITKKPIVTASASG